MNAHTTALLAKVKAAADEAAKHPFLPEAIRDGIGALGDLVIALSDRAARHDALGVYLMGRVTDAVMANMVDHEAAARTLRELIVADGTDGPFDAATIDAARELLAMIEAIAQQGQGGQVEAQPGEGGQVGVQSASITGNAEG